MKTNKSWKTNLVGYVGLASVIIAFTLVALGKATLSEIGVTLGSVSALLVTVNGFLSKDSTASHTFSSQRTSTLDPDKDEFPKTKG